MNPNITRPIPFPVRGIMIFANQSPIPEPWIIPISNETNPINGNIVLIIVCIASLDAW